MDYQFKIDKGIPIPEQRGKWRVFKDMEVGDSICVPCELGTKASSAAASVATKQGKKFTTRTVEDGKLRIWRVS